MIYAIALVVIILIGIIFLRPKDTTMLIQYTDGTWFKGLRKGKFAFKETKGTHHFIVMEGSTEFVNLKGMKLAVPINQPKYFIIEENK